jgi:hypothetical protein
MTADSPGMLLTWMNVDPQHEDEFNRWYDREHIEERVRIPGFLSGARYLNAGGGPRYLGLYRTESLAVFDSPAYRDAFGHQTPWSVANLGRMRDAIRRVSSIAIEVGFGSGAWVAVVRLGSTVADSQIAAVLPSLLRVDGIVSARLLIPDSRLSTPLPAERLDNRVVDPMVIVDATSQSAAGAGGRLIVDEIALQDTEPAVLHLMWQLTKADLHG